MADYSNEVRKPVSVKTLTDRMERILVEYETRTNAQPCTEEEELEALLANYQMPYTTEKGLDNQQEILEFAAQRERNGDINQNDRTSTEQTNQSRTRSRTKRIGPASRQDKSNNQNKNSGSSSERDPVRERKRDATNAPVSNTAVKKGRKQNRASTRPTQQKAQ